MGIVIQEGIIEVLTPIPQYEQIAFMRHELPNHRDAMGSNHNSFDELYEALKHDVPHLFMPNSAGYDVDKIELFYRTYEPRDEYHPTMRIVIERERLQRVDVPAGHTFDKLASKLETMLAEVQTKATSGFYIEEQKRMNEYLEKRFSEQSLE